MEPLALTKAALYTPFSFIEEATVLVRQGKIAAAGPADEIAIPAEFREVPLEGLILAPGFIDQHLHGSGRAAVMSGTPEALNEIGKFQATHGVTGFLATTAAASQGQLFQVARAYAELNAAPAYKGARCLGLHLEGPYGALDTIDLSKPADGSRLPDWLAIQAVHLQSGRGIKLVTLAPELPGALELAGELKKNGIVASIGHSAASFETARAAIEAGFGCVTDCFAGFPLLDPRQPGIIGAALTDAALPVEIVVQDDALHPATVALVWQLKSPERIILASNGQPFGPEQSRETLTMDEAVRKTFAMIGCDLADVLRMATYNPARLLGVNKKKGSIYPGKDADIIAMTTDLDVVMTMVEGEVISGLISL
ncbi:N-acetylglucosamine-6-phosphate deacetylase [Hydrogenispora ethanolica]|uniref:N-acetylglucosamine-6-phosphate deacetylase n=1 Tax=Hydrogenispora ethanolica TaxID=1082276 RepID=A0A4R1RMD9_HYDET|nr:amidohydrolase family protein [Hydrogenispora ethanolica]TCL67441.1 N-acetylglucosamine-6-phosphate deacetylase [Hydrogenispora ethanolica]